MANLFGLPTPDEVRQNTRRRLFSGGQGGAGGGANLIGRALGYGARRAFGGDTAEETRAKKVQGILNSTIGELGLDPATMDMQGMQGLGQAYAKNLLKEGELDLGFSVMQKIQGMQPATSERDNEFWKEERGAAGQAVKKLDNKAASMRSDYGKLQQLAKQTKGNSTSARAARNSMIANIVRLNSPGIVSESELKTYSGAQTTTAALLQWARGKGFNADALVAGVDPSGEGFDAEGVLNIGKSLILGQAKPLFDQYDDAKGRAERSGISSRAMGTIFGKNRNIDGLRKLATPSSGGKGTKPANLDQSIWNAMTPQEKALF